MRYLPDTTNFKMTREDFIEPTEDTRGMLSRVKKPALLLTET